MSARTKLTAILVVAVVAILGIQGYSYLEDRNRAVAALRAQVESAATAPAVTLADGPLTARSDLESPQIRAELAKVLLRAQTVSDAVLQTALVLPEEPQGDDASGPTVQGTVVTFVGIPTPIAPEEGGTVRDLPAPEPLRYSASARIGDFVVGVARVDRGREAPAFVVVVGSLEGLTATGRGIAVLLTTAAAAILLFLAVVSRGFTRRLELLAQAAERIREGDLAYRVEISGRDEIAAVGEAFNRMAEAVQSNRRALADAVSELAQASAELETRAEENRRILERTVGAVDEERRRLATDLHDSTIQALQSAAMQAEYLGMLIERGRTEEVAGLLRDLTTRLRDAADELRKLIFDLRPPSLDRGGLMASLENRLREAEERAGFSTTLEVEDGLRIPPEEEEVVYRFCREAISNAVKHSAASELQVRIWRSGDTLRAVVSDNGKGFKMDDHPPEGHFGLVGMKDRAKLAGGEVNIQSAPGQGTRVELVLPLPDSSARGSSGSHSSTSVAPSSPASTAPDTAPTPGSDSPVQEPEAT